MLFYHDSKKGMKGCVFCDIVRKKIDSELTVFENDYIIGHVSLRQKPGNHGHILLIPKVHVKNIYELDKSFDAPMMSALRLLSTAVKRAFQADGIHIRQNNEAAAGQDVFHLHFHIIPRFEGDYFESENYSKLSFDERIGIANQLKPFVDQLIKLE